MPAQSYGTQLVDESVTACSSDSADPFSYGNVHWMKFEPLACQRAAAPEDNSLKISECDSVTYLDDRRREKMIWDLFTDIPYVQVEGSDGFRHLDLYMPKDAREGAPQPLIVFVHGGAWRSEDKAEHSGLARQLLEATGFPVAVPNYRLTPRDASPHESVFHHPGHTEDILDALRFLLTTDDPRTHGYNRNAIWLIGHSCSAHMLMSIFMDTSSVSPSLQPPPALVQAVKGIIVSEGIYDLDLLLASFPKYQEWFLGAAFGWQEPIHKYSVTNFSPLSQDIRWLVIHSKGDTLIDLAQSEAAAKHLRKVAEGSLVTTNFDQLTQEHNEILSTTTYVNILKEFILQE